MLKKYSLYTFVLGIFAVLIAVSFALIYFSSTQHRKDLIETAIEEKIHLADIVDKTVASPVWAFPQGYVDIAGLEKALMRELKKFEDVIYLRVITQNGRITHSSDESEVDKSINECFEESGTCSTDYISIIKKVLLTFSPEIRDETYQGKEAKTIIYPGSDNKVIWITFSMASIKEMIRTTLIRDAIVISLILFLAIAIIFFILRSIIRPLETITRACQDIRGGNLNAKINISSKTELGLMADTFNEMMKDLKKSYEKLEEAKNVLEIKVAARTKELQEVNESLEQKVQERTKELRDKITEQERLIKLTIGRELKMAELKKEIKKNQPKEETEEK